MYARISSYEIILTGGLRTSTSSKVNCDVAVGPKNSEGKLAIILRDRKGKLIDGMVKSTQVFSSLQGELKAIREACFMVIALDLK